MGKEATKEVGTIGQMYENRKSKQVGVLESRDDKCKTLMFRDAEGKSFVVTYSTFHSAWRKYAGSEIIETSTQKEEKKSQTKKEIAKAEKIISKELDAEKNSEIDEKTKVETVKALRTIMEKIISDKGYNFEIKVSYRGGLAIKNKRKNILEVWSRHAENRISICMSDELANRISVSDDVEVLNGNELGKHWVLNIKYRFEKSRFEDMISIVLEALNDMVNEGVEESSEEENE